MIGPCFRRRCVVSSISRYACANKPRTRSLLSGVTLTTPTTLELSDPFSPRANIVKQFHREFTHPLTINTKKNQSQYRFSHQQRSYSDIQPQQKQRKKGDRLPKFLVITFLTATVATSIVGFTVWFLLYSEETGRDLNWLMSRLMIGNKMVLHAEDENKTNQPKSSSEMEDRETVVILGTGWGAISVFEHLDLSKFNVILISPRNYSLFTPMLASVTTGHVDNRSIVDSIHNHIERRTRKYKKYNPSVEFYEAKCFDVDWENQVVLCEQTNTQKHLLSHADQKERTFTVPYDKLVIAVGCRTNTFNTPGVVENCYFLKEIDDAEGIRLQVFTNLERANCPGLSEDQLRKMLNFCIVGGGPTGIETAAEINEVLKREVKHYFPHLAQYMLITVVQSADHILNTFDQKMSSYAERKFSEEGIKVITNSRVIRVSPTDVTARDKKTNTEFEIPYGLCLWSTGIMQHPLIEKLTSKITAQTHTKSLEVNKHLQVEGIGKTNVYALGDCAKVNQPHLLAKMKEIFEEADANKDGFIQIEELERYGKAKASEYPHLAVFIQKSLNDFYKFDDNGDGKLDESEFTNLLKFVDNRLEPLPATAQVANQQGKYLADQFNYGQTKTFRYNHLGSFAYLGRGSALADIGGHVGSGFEAWLTYKAVYFSKQVSMKNKIAIVSDWTRTMIFGRDTSKV